MGYSSLCSSIHRNPSYNHTSGRGGERVCKITPHHMAVKWTGERCAESFDVRGRNASANYCIGYDGEIVGCVDENDRSWCSASGWNDRKAIMLERSDVMVALPGGIGTLDEVFTTMAAHSIGYHNKRVVLFALDGFWDGLAAVLEEMDRRGFINVPLDRYLSVARSWDELEAALG